MAFIVLFFQFTRSFFLFYMLINNFLGFFYCKQES